MLGRLGWGLYRTAEVTNRAQDQVSPLISALAKHMQRKVRVLDFLSACCWWCPLLRVASKEGTEPKSVGMTATIKSVDGHSTSSPPVFTPIKKIVWTPSEEKKKEKKLNGDKSSMMWKGGAEMLQVRQRLMLQSERKRNMRRGSNFSETEESKMEILQRVWR